MITDNNTNKKNSGRGFAGMDEDRQREIASKGGQSQGKENNLGTSPTTPLAPVKRGERAAVLRELWVSETNLNG